MARIRETRSAEYTVTHPLATDSYPPQGAWTYADYTRLPNDGWKYEVIRGELYMAPAPRPIHQLIVVRISAALENFVQQSDLGAVYVAPIDVTLPGTLGDPVQPDVLFIRADRLEIVGETRIEGAPDLVVEVLSPSNWADDRRIKYEIYAEAGIPEYWIVDPRQRTVEVFVLSSGVYDLLGRFEAGETVSSQILDGFNAPVAAILPA